MSDESPPLVAEGAAKTGKERRLPRGCGILLALAGNLAVLFLVAGYYQYKIIQGVTNKQKQSTAFAIADAVQQFYADYKRLPLPSGPIPTNGDRDTDTSSAHGFVAVLLGKEASTGENQNQRNTNYAEGLRAAKPQPGGDYPWVRGVIYETTHACFGIVDNYGKPFRVRFDTNGDKVISNPNPAGVAAGRPTLSEQVVVWGAGKDGKWDTWDDNPKSWWD